MEAMENFYCFEADMSSSVHVDDKEKDILILGTTQGLGGTTLTVEAKYPINFIQSGKRLY